MDSWIGPVLGLTVAFLMGAAVLGVMWRLSRRNPGAPVHPTPPPTDTVTTWPPRAARVLSRAEALARGRLLDALPGILVLAHVPVSRFIRVPTRHSYSEWLRRIGHTCVDLLVCDPQGRPLVAVEIRRTASPNDGRRQGRREELARVLDAAAIKLQVWRDDAVPDVTVIRGLLAAAEVPDFSIANGPSRNMNDWLDEGVDVISLPFEEPDSSTHPLANSTWFDDFPAFDDTTTDEAPSVVSPARPAQTPSR